MPRGDFWYKLERANDLRKSIDKLGTLPQKCVTQAARKGANKVMKAVKIIVPVLTGMLKKGLMLKGERANKKGKKVYDVRMNPAFNDIYAKEHIAGENASAVRSGQKKVGDKTRAYYPASMEFGYFAKNGEYIPGYHFMRDGAVEAAPEAEDTMILELTKNIDKEWNKRNGN